ncbi:DUF423 domain-containing protein [Kordia algicida OT-1]|uniref:DUF423 domain-containing protein n=1 Tax=Kordia algicida OT-1 TaxID=391587 RepID=A9EAI5_9FLAO|nr:DUF423 domain-containing protein [Kordia algicida]EDP94634.1 hypothetical protein KAOT1_04435 [Kordia algicida OT-1]
MEKIVLNIATLYGALGIIFGAFGAHALKKVFSEELLKSFETGVKYQMYHALVLLVLGFQLSFTETIEKSAAWCLILGTFLFSFSIYGLCLSSAKGKKLRFLGPITPLGGLLLVMGWILLGISFL